MPLFVCLRRRSQRRRFRFLRPASKEVTIRPSCLSVSAWRAEITGGFGDIYPPKLNPHTRLAQPGFRDGKTHRKAAKQSRDSLPHGHD